MRGCTRRSVHRLGTVCLGALATVAAGCSTEDVSSTAMSAPTTALTTAVTTLPSSRTAPPVTTQPVTLPPTTTTVPATSAPPTTVPATFAPGSVEAQVVDATLESWRLYRDAMQDPFNDDKVRAAGQAHAGQVQQTIIENIAEYRLNNWRSTENPTVPASITLYRDGVVVDAAAGTASVTYCDVNSAIVVETAGNPDGSDRVLDDDVSSMRVRLDLTLVDGRWTVGGGELVMSWPGAVTCPDLP